LDHDGPVLSVYLSVNARYPENQGEAYKVRLKDALGDLDVPQELAARIRGSVDKQTRPRARTLVFFAAEDGLFERYEFQVDLPEAFRFGEPYLAPLVLALDEHEPYGVALLDAERFRFFVSEPMGGPPDDGESTGSGFFRELDVSPGSPGPRSGMDQEPQSRRTEANVHKWFNELGELTRKLAFQNGVRHLILAGPRERTSEFRERLPQEMAERVVAEENIPSEAPEKGFFDRLEAVYEQAEKERQMALISETRERGVRGVKDTIEALQEGRVYHLVALWGLEGEVRWSDAEGLAITDITQEESPYSEEPTRVRPLMDALLDLAAERGARVELVRAEDGVAATPGKDARQEREPQDPAGILREEFEGLAGLLRY
jgi:hypothetical protein